MGAGLLDILSRAGFGSSEADRILQQLTALLTSRLRAPPGAAPRASNTIDDLGVEMLVLGVQALARRPRKGTSASGSRRRKGG